jgi:hypothetical protein
MTTLRRFAVKHFLQFVQRNAFRGSPLSQSFAEPVDRCQQSIYLCLAHDFVILL